MALPELPVNIPREQRQVEGERVKEGFAQTHKGRKRKELPPMGNDPEGPIRYLEDDQE